MRLFCIVFIFANFIKIDAEVHTIYAHGILDHPSGVKRFYQAISSSVEYIKTVVFPDIQKEVGYGINRIVSEVASKFKIPINRSKMYMGQLQDIDAFFDAIQTCEQDDQLILFGCSRGGAATVSFLAKHNPENVVAVVLDGSPADMLASADPIMAQFGLGSSCRSLIFSVLFPAYPQDSVTPLQSVAHIKNKKLPILLIHSQNDCVVPYSHSLRLYKEFIKHGFEHVYIVLIPEGRHAFLLQEPKAKDLYLKAVHSFYKFYDLPYDKMHASEDMDFYRPALDVVEQKILDCEFGLSDFLKKRRLLIAGGIFSGVVFAYFKKHISNS